MLQVSFISEFKDKVLVGLRKKRVANAEELVEAVLKTDQDRKRTQVERDEVLAEANGIAKQVGQLMKNGQKDQAEKVKQEAANLKDTAKNLSDKVAELEALLTQQLYQLPNIPHESVPEGAGADDNEIVHQRGSFPQMPEDALPHWELIKKYDLIDFEMGTKVTGAGFPFYKGKAARLQRALINFFLDQAAAAGYTEVQPPILINEASGYGTGQLPDKEGQMYKLEGMDFYLIPTAEVPITNMFRDAILQASELPLKYAGYTPCFRKEAGSWGAHVRGLNRLHQFDKVELVQITLPELSYATLEQMVTHVERLLDQLELPYRRLRLCGGDISFNAALCYDLEVFSAAQEKWLEVSSVSNFEAFQANRLKLRYKDENKKTQLLHTLNGSALALPRIMAALLENNQSTDGIRLPKVLHPYCGFEVI